MLVYVILKIMSIIFLERCWSVEVERLNSKDQKPQLDALQVTTNALSSYP